MRRTLLAAALLAVACTSRTWPNVTTTPSGPELALAPRPADCKVEFYRTRPPDRPYDEVAALHFEGSLADTPATAHEAVRRQACALGADAVFVTHELVPSSLAMEATALSYRDAREQHRAEAAQRQAAADAQAAERRRAADAALAKRKEACGRNERASAAGYLPATAKEIAIVHARADRLSGVVQTVARGACVWVAPGGSGGWRRVWLGADARGWMEEGSLDL